MKSLKIEQLPLEALKPYEKNARKHAEKDITAIVASIEEFGFNDPVGIWGPDNIIVEGHGRLEAARKLGMKTVPCIRLDHLSDEQRRAYALAHNKTAELSEWDFDVLPGELAGIFNIDMSEFEFRLPNAETDFFERENRNDDSREEGNEEYNEFLDKFEPKKTTDDCYTPDNIYETVADFVTKTYGVDRGRMVRPFYPGGDYQHFGYAPGAVVVDNPPFSILSEILTFYKDKGVPFFLFAPTLTLFSSAASTSATTLPCGVTVTYENGASVNTSFATNLEDPSIRVRTYPELYKTIEAVNDENLKQMHRDLPKYSYPDQVITAAIVARWCKYGIEYLLPDGDCVPISELDAQKEQGKAIFGKGFLLSERAAAERAAAQHWELSEREWGIVRGLGVEKKQ